MGVEIDIATLLCTQGLYLWTRMYPAVVEYEAHIVQSPLDNNWSKVT